MIHPRWKCAGVVVFLPLVVLFGAVRAWEVFHPLSSLAEMAAHDHSAVDGAGLCSLGPQGGHHCIHSSTIFDVGEAPTHPPGTRTAGEVGCAGCGGSLAEIQFVSTRDPPSPG
jgi:hypothetical protein